MNLVASGVGFGYPGIPVFEHLDFCASKGMRIGVVGENGTGKSTLLALLAGKLTPVKGTVRRKGTLAIVEQEFEPTPGQTIGDLVQTALSEVRKLAADLEVAAQRLATEGDIDEVSNILAKAEHLRAWDADRRIDESLTRFKAPRDFDRPLETLSVGERYRVRLACRLAEQADFLLLDEPTNHLDQAGIEYLTARLQQWYGGIVLVTHDRELLDDVATAIFDLNPSIDGKPMLYGKPGYENYRKAKAEALKRWRSRYVREQKRTGELLATLDASYEGLSDEWRPPKGSEKHRRGTRARQHVKNADRQLIKLEAEAVPIPEPPMELAFPDLPPFIYPPGFETAPSASSTIGVPQQEAQCPTMTVSDPAVIGSEGYTRLDLRGETIEIAPGGRLLVVGPNGSGKSTLLSVMAGTLPLTSGIRSSASGLRLGIVGQENAELITAGIPTDKLTGFDAIENEILALLSRGRIDPNQVVPLLELGLLTEAELEKPVKDLSAGQRRRFELAKVLVTAPQMLILDEPTNHLSIDLVDELTKALDKTQAAVVIATHDRRMRKDLAHWPTLEL